MPGDTTTINILIGLLAAIFTILMAIVGWFSTRIINKLDTLAVDLATNIKNQDVRLAVLESWRLSQDRRLQYLSKEGD